MFKKCILILAASCMMYSCATQTESNPFLTEFQTPNGVPPFDKIKLEHYEPAFQKGIEEQNANIQAIIDNTEAPTFENVIVALDNSSPTLDRVGGVFFNLTEAETTDELTALSMKLAPTLAEHEDNISLNQELFKKVDAVYSQKDALGLTREQQRLLEKTHKKFIRSGANLPADKQARLREINKQLSTLGITFSNNILNENNDFKLYVGKEEDLAGLPQWFRESAMAEARATGQEGKWLFTLHNASRLPFLQYSANRPLREQMYKAYINRGNNNDKNDNKKIITDIVRLRLEKAQLLGFDCYSNFVLDNTMAKNSTAVMDFLNNLWSYALPKAKAEAAELQKLMDKEGKGEKLEAWDWWYYTEKLRKEKYNLEEEEIKPYFKLENVREGAFAVANKLYGITLTKLEGIPVYHPDVEVFEVKAADGSQVGIFYVLWSYALPKAKAEAAELQKLMDKEGKGEKLEAWDWWYYTEKLRKEKYNLEEEEIKPYFKLENVREGAFAVANKLYGITLTKLEGIPVYHPDVEVFEVKAADGSQVGIFYVDYFPRPGKSGGAWMSNYREQQGSIRPLVCNVCSFTKPVGDTPSLLTIDEVETLFHEFGHALHGLLTQCQYKGTSGTNVVRDFVELPSQINEHWATEPEVLKMYAKHYKTGEVIPDSLIEKILNQKTFNQGFMTTELLAAAILDMNLHNLTDTEGLDVVAYEKEAMDQLGLIPEIAPRYRTTYFNHIIGGYAAGYYSYLWANVLDNDAFEAFKEHGIFDKQTADLFRQNVLEKGDSEDPMTLYKNFRGTEPQLDPMLKNRGMK